MKRILWAGALMAALGTAPAALAQDAAVAADVRCIAIAGLAAGQAPAEQQGQIVAGMMYFLGKLDARAPNLDIAAAIRLQLVGLQANGQAEAQRCAAEVSGRGRALQDIGQKLAQSPARP